MHEWIEDNGQTPHIVVDAGVQGVEVPAGYVQEGRVVLNLASQATEALLISNEVIEFNARFGGQPSSVRIPMEAVLGIYARETGQGMIFTGDESDPEPPPREEGGGRPKLTVVK